MAVPTLVSSGLASDGLTLSMVWSEAVSTDISDEIEISSLNRSGTVLGTYSSGTTTTTLVYTLASTGFQNETLKVTQHEGDVQSVSTADPCAAVDAASVTNSSTKSWMLRHRRRSPVWGRSRR